jgi:WD40 repeat protein
VSSNTTALLSSSSRAVVSSSGQTSNEPIQGGVNSRVHTVMRGLLALPVLAALVALAALSAQARPELVVSVGHSGPPLHAAFAGGYLATAIWSTVALVDLSTGLTVARLRHSAHVTTLEANPAGNLIAVGTCGRSVELWDVSSRRLVHRLRIQRECADSLSFSPDGALLAIVDVGCCTDGDCCGGDACTSGGGVQIWDVGSGRLKQELAKGGGIRSVVFGANGRWLAGADINGKTTVFEWPSGRQLRTFGGTADAGSPESGVSSPDGKYLAWREFGALQVWEVASGTPMALPAPRPDDEDEGGRDRQRDTSDPAWTEQRVPAKAAEFLDDGRLAYVDDDHLRIVTLPNGPIEDMPLEKPKIDVRGHMALIIPPSWLRIHRNGRSIAGTFESRTGLWDTGAATLRDLTSPALADAETLQWNRSGLAWKEGDWRIWTWRESSGQLLERETDDRDPPHEQLIARFKNLWSVKHVAFSPDGRWSAASTQADHQNAVKVWPGQGGGDGDGVTLDASDVTYGPQPPAFSGDSRWLATFIKGRSLMLWSTGSWKLERTWKLAGTGRALTFAPEGPRLAIAAEGETAIWDARTRRKLVTLTGPGSSRVTQVAWSPDGHRVVTSSDDGVLRFWNASDGRLFASLYAIPFTTDWLLVTPDGRFDGSERALATVVAWRTGDRVSLDKRLTDQYRVRDLWRDLSNRDLPR